MKYKYIFGPIPSRRLGVSLGVDLVRHKVCSLNCIYCEAGKTTELTSKRDEYIPTKDLIEELDSYLSNSPEIDFITFSGAGEPTLHIDLGKIAGHIKNKYPKYKLALITNGTLFWQETLRHEVRFFDVILPSLDAVSCDIFEKINRPATDLDNNQIIDGLIKLREEFKGELWVEVFVIAGINDSDSELSLLKEVLLKIKPDRVQLNSLDRPGTEHWIEKTDEYRLKEIEALFYPLPVEIIAKFKDKPIDSGYKQDIENAIVETIRRRPCTMKDLCTTLGRHINEVTKYVTHLVETGVIVSEQQDRGVFYKIKQER